MVKKVNIPATGQDPFVGGDHLKVGVTIPDIPDGQVLQTVWFTVKAKETDPDPGILQKVLTTTEQAGIGQITDVGTGDNTGYALVYFLPADTKLLVKGYPYDVQVLTDAGELYTPVKGKIKAEQGVTNAES